jgi:ferredoxin
MNKLLVYSTILAATFLIVNIFAQSSAEELNEFSGSLRKVGNDWFLQAEDDLFGLILPPNEFLAENEVAFESKQKITIFGTQKNEELEVYRILYQEREIPFRDDNGKALWSVRKSYFLVDPIICIGCRLCVKVCPTSSITMVKGKAVIDADTCIACGFCAFGDGLKFKGCPVEAISQVD